MSITFEVDPVAPERAQMPTHPVGRLLELQLGERGRIETAETDSFEAVRASATELSHAFAHPFVGAATFAYAGHRPLALSPDHLWAVIELGVATHIARDPERFRARLVAHDGTLEVKVRRDDIAPGDPNLPWDEVVEAFVDGLRETMGRRTELFVEPFSTTDGVASTVHHVLLMDAVKHYVNYSLGTLCGIPSITLEGEAADWRSIRRRVEHLRELELGWWCDLLEPIVDQFVSAAEDDVDVDFWRAFVKQNNTSGGPYYTGWMAYLFPYLRYYRRAPEADAYHYVVERNALLEPDTLRAHGWQPDAPLSTLARRVVDEFDPMSFPDEEVMPFVKSSNFLSSLARVPFVWEFPHLGVKRSMELVAGFVGIGQDETSGCIRPELGWGVRPRGDDGE